MALTCWFAYLGHLPVAGTWAFWLAKPVSVIVFTILAVGELIGDKLPQTPDRTFIVALVARVVFGGIVGAAAATGLSGSAVEGAILGALSALVSSFLTFHLRQYLVKGRKLHDLPVALTEDALTIGLSVLALGIITG